MNRLFAVATVVTGGVFALSVPASAQTGDPDHEWCEDEHRGRNTERYCEVRTLTFNPSGTIEVDARQNGGIRIEGWERDDVRILAKVQAWTRNGDNPEDVVGDIEIRTGGVIRADGPNNRRRRGWSVSYRMMVPRNSDLDLRAHNGGISVSNVSGDIESRTVNGGTTLEDVEGDVRARTTNGGVTVRLSQDRWTGDGLDVETTNGGVTLTLPSDFQADLTTGTVNGGIDIDFPITVQGRLNRRRIQTTLNGGGPPVRVVTTNGGVRIRRAR